MAGYRHGLYISEVPTSLIPPVRVDAAMPVFFVTAPVHLAADPYAVTQVPKLCFTYQEAVEAFGFSLRPEIWDNYTACQAIYSQFVLYGIAPMVMVNVLDPAVHVTEVTAQEITLVKGRAIIPADGVLIDSVIVSGGNDVTYTDGKQYTLAFDRDGFVNINTIRGSSEPIAENATLTVSYSKLAPEKVDIFDIIGGYSSVTGKNTGLEIVSDIFPRFRLIPGSIVAPGFSGDPAVAAVMETKASNINGHFRSIALNDIPTMNDESYLRYTDVPAWKNENNYVSTYQVNGYPMLRMGGQLFYYSVQLAGLIGKTDSLNSDIPYNGPSNKNLKANGLSYADGSELILNNEQANYLNGQGVITAINWINGWVAWGNRTGVYPGNTDPKDSFIPIRRMFNWIGNTIVLTYWNKIDFPISRRLISTIVDSINIWFNGLANREFILGGRIDPPSPAENPLTDLIDGIMKFHVHVTPPPPWREGDFILEYDPIYLQTLFDM